MRMCNATLSKDFGHASMAASLEREWPRRALGCSLRVHARAAPIPPPPQVLSSCTEDAE